MSHSAQPNDGRGDSFDLPLIVFHLRNVSPFFGALALFAESVVSEECETAATDGRRLFFNPRFMAAHSLPEQLGILVHELLHAGLRHVDRLGAANPDLWNIAADIVVNGMIDASPGLELPASALRDKDLECFNVEEVYKVLLRRTKRPDSLRFIGRDLLEPSASSDQKGNADLASGLDEHWNSAFAQAAVVAQMGNHPGKLPAGVERAIRRAVDPPLDWRSLLWRYLTRSMVDFQGLDRRFIGEDLYLDALDGETLTVAACVDTSGSVDPKSLGRFLNEIRAILAAYPNTRIELYSCDASLYGPWLLDSAECPFPKIKGGGGTSFKPFFESLKNSPPDVAVYLTDGFGVFPCEPPCFSTLWVVMPGGLDSEAFPFGETVRMLMT